MAAGIACGAWQLDKLTLLPISDQSFDLIMSVEGCWYGTTILVERQKILTGWGNAVKQCSVTTGESVITVHTSVTMTDGRIL